MPRSSPSASRPRSTCRALRWRPCRPAPGRHRGARSKGERPVCDVDADRFFAAGVYDRAKLAAGDRVAGPAVIEQFDATTMVLAGQAATVDPYGILVIESAA